MQKLLIPAIVLVMAVAVFCVLFFVKKETSITIEEPFYQFFLDERVDYGENTVATMGKYGIVFDDNGNKAEATSLPMYSVIEKKLILPVDYCWYEPSSGIEWKIPAFSSISMDSDDIVYCEGEFGTKILGGGFLRAPGGNYIFLSSLTVYVNGRPFKTEPLSFCTMEQGFLRIYDYESETLFLPPDGVETVKAVCDGFDVYEVNLIAGIFYGPSGDSCLLMASPQFGVDIAKK